MSSVAQIVALIESGDLIPVQVFGGMETCDGCHAEVEWGYGLCDRFSTHAPGGSDCNRAAFFLLRPSDAAMKDPAVRAALGAVLENPNEDLWEPGERRGHVVALADDES